MDHAIDVRAVVVSSIQLPLFFPRCTLDPISLPVWVGSDRHSLLPTQDWCVLES